MRDVVVGTAGHIDHGKTLLVKALTGMDADRWEEEKRRGITLDIGFATLTRERGTLHFVDLPGHERFIKNMLAGATGIDLCLLVVAADESVMPQTVEHAEILSLLGVTRGVVALTKVDLVDAETRELALLELSEFLEAHGLSALPVVPVSAVTGEGLPALERALFEAAASCPEAPAGRPFRLPVDRVFPVKGFGTVVTGTCIDGALSLGAEVEVHPGAGRSRVRGLQVFGRSVEAVRAGQRSAVNIPDLAHESLRRGHLLADPGTVWPTRLLFVRFHLLPSARKALRTGTVGTLHVHTQELEAHVHLAGLAALEPGGEAVAQLRLLEKAAAWPGDRFIFRLPSPQRTVAGGEVLLPAARKARWRRAREGRILEALRAGRLLEALLLEAGPLGVSPSEVRSRLGLREGQESPLRTGEPAPARWAADAWWLHPSAISTRSPARSIVRTISQSRCRLRTSACFALLRRLTRICSTLCRSTNTGGVGLNWRTMRMSCRANAVEWMRKDLAICLDEARSNGAKLPVTRMVDTFYAEVQAMGGGRWDTSSLIARLKKRNPTSG
jgi:selenocysteine-specific elongation factor